MGERILLNKYDMVSLHVLNLKIGGGAGNFLYTLYFKRHSHHSQFHKRKQDGGGGEAEGNAIKSRVEVE
jgi:hypothetical protein